MYPAPRYRVEDWLAFILVLAAAAGLRIYYVLELAHEGQAVPGTVAAVQNDSLVRYEGRTDTEVLVENLHREGTIHGFVSHAPLSADARQETAHVAPGYPIFRWLIEMGVAELKSETVQPLPTIIWVQVALSSLAAALYFAVARRAFHSTLVGFLAGLLCAANPYWIVNVAEMNDGVLASFFLALVMAFGVRAGQRGGPLTSFLFGLFLAALTLVRAAYVPFAFVSLMWFCLRSRHLRHGWLYAALVLFGFANGSAAWAIHNWQKHQEVIPVADSLFWHLWIGNNPQATGGPPPLDAKITLDHDTRQRLRDYFNPADGQKPTLAPQDLRLLALLGKETFEKIENTKGQPAAYGHLAPRVVDEIVECPQRTMERRLRAAAGFAIGDSAYKGGPIVAIPPTSQWDCCREWIPTVFWGVAIGMIGLALVGWRWSYGWRRASMPLQLAFFWIPLPYILTYSQFYHGPRLPLDGPLMVLAAFVLCCCIPVVGTRLFRGETTAMTPTQPTQT